MKKKTKDMDITLELRNDDCRFKNSPSLHVVKPTWRRPVRFSEKVELKVNIRR